MKKFLAVTLALFLSNFFALDIARTEDAAPTMSQKLQAYIECTNSLSERAYDSRSRYFDWAAKSGPTGKERIIYGTYTISDPSECNAKIDAANKQEPHDADLEAAGTAYAQAVTALAPLLVEADDYYTQENYKDDKMAKGKALHPKLVTAWNDFEAADQKLSSIVSAMNDKVQAEHLVAIEKDEGRKANYYKLALMTNAKALMRVENGNDPKKIDLPKVTENLTTYETTVNDALKFKAENPDAKLGSMFLDSAKSFLVTAKGLMRRIRDKVPYSSGDKMMLNANGAGWMVDASPPRLVHDYNGLVDAYNRGSNF
jgi:Protein of unknown function (DUF3829)